MPLIRQRSLLPLTILLLLCATFFLFACAKKKSLAPEGMVFIPGGTFIMGSDRTDTEGRAAEFGMTKPLYLDEHPQRTVFLPAYYIDKFELTNKQYAAFVQATRSKSPISWPKGKIPQGKENYPVTEVNWYDADRSCQWMGKRLPTEAEWEKAGRGPDGQEYPWGSEFDTQKANTGATGRGGVTPGGSFPSGQSPYGVHDLSGNVWEWVSDWYQAYPESSYKSAAFGEKNKSLRGSSWGGIGHYALAVFYRSAHRFYADPAQGFPDAGFRCAKSVEKTFNLFSF